MMKQILSPCLTLWLLGMLSACSAGVAEPPSTALPSATSTVTVPATTSPPTAMPAAAPTYPPIPDPDAHVTPTVPIAQATFTPAMLRADIDELFAILESVHPNLYAVRPKAAIDRERAQLSAALTTPLTRTAFYRRLAPLVASLNDGVL